MKRHIKDVGLLAGSALAVLALTGCAGNRAAPEQEANLQRAGRTIAEAEQEGAYQFGSSELNLAREKLRAAEQAVEEGEAEEAQRLAAEAELDAQLAVAITRNRQTQDAVQEVRASIRALQDELQRSTTRQQTGF
jgi:hypothetical protein